MSIFIKGYSKISLFGSGEHGQGLYENQIAAVGATLAHFSTRKEPALVTMPTGTGKTAVMIILSYALKAQKVLVVTPSQLVREQIAKQFRSPEMLIANGILDSEFLPKVYEVKTEISEYQQWTSILNDNDVIVGIPSTLNKVPKSAPDGNLLGFDVVFVDEAHHSRAESWKYLLDSYPNAKQILLTATPFRRDKKDIKARLIYSYPLKQAYENGLFSRINFVPIQTKALLTDEAKNIAIAKKTEEVFKARQSLEHKIIVRTDTKSAANELKKIYAQHTGLKLDMIHSKLSDLYIARRIKELREGKVDGIICVDMMGEGYDFPALKIAAVHVPHKSLAITLQFVGRISRTNIVNGNIATVIAGEHEFAIESYQLFKHDTKDWSIVLPDLHRAKIQKTEQEQDFFDSFENLTEPAPLFDFDSETQIEVENDDLRPSFHAKAYQIIPPPQQALLDPDEQDGLIDISIEVDFSGTSLFSNPVIRHHNVSADFDVAVFIVSELKKPDWYQKQDMLVDVQNELVVVYYNKDNRILFICSSVKENEIYEHIAEQFLTLDTIHDMIPLPLLKRVMAGWKEAKMYNVGMKSRKTKGSSESYKNILGSQAEKSVLSTDKYSYTRGHSFGGGYEPLLGKQVLAGISTSSKVWTLGDGKIKYVVEWLKFISRKVGDPDMDKLPAPLSDLDSGRVVKRFSDEPVFMLDWDPSFYHKLTAVYFLNEVGEPAEKALICSCDITLIEQTFNAVTLSVSKGNVSAMITYTLDPKIEFNYAQQTTHTLAIAKGERFTDSEVFLKMMRTTPIHLYYENLDKQIGKIHFDFLGELDTISSDKIVAHSWPANVNVQKEFYSAEDFANNATDNNSIMSIHEYIIEIAKNEYDVVFYDHGSLEIADVVGFKKGKIQFFHCKSQSGATPSCNVTDIYEVSGQAMKSVNWAHRKLLLKQIYDRADQNNSHHKLKKGSLEQIKIILEEFENPIIPVEITIVQPGLKTQNLSTTQQNAFERIRRLLSGTEAYLQDVSSCSLSIMAS
ncbi:Superfamily II DNA or RNA helicase [Pedobacter suwonensis]|uniref:Superfamily II DNA or RNA helicase n=1 Tax=Pedobacter suwonensis TaxID=332999 RepID=A0A1I0SFM1_9SPHI|nr:DEAD/DEAH box helicase family protein [Pedobacter suwonensis]SFA38237.1 Superfamily II DNA or RNA helicase [Pedobacter suwonensis]